LLRVALRNMLALDWSRCQIRCLQQGVSDRSGKLLRLELRGETVAKRSSTDLALMALGVVAWVAAAFFGAIPTTVETQIPAGEHITTHTKVPSPSGAGAACGFALAGGLCFLGAALISRPTLGTRDAASGAAPDRGGM
jgi:hypothetical protein